MLEIIHILRLVLFVTHKNTPVKITRFLYVVPIKVPLPFSLVYTIDLAVATEAQGMNSIVMHWY